MTSQTTIDGMLCAALRGEAVEWPRDASEDFEGAVLARARSHRVHLLLEMILRRESWGSTWPPALRDRLARLARADTIREMVQSREVVRVLDGLAAEGILGLLMKGTSLAYTTYTGPNLRHRVDTDLLIPDEQRERAERALCRLGYTRGARISGTLVEYQAPYFREDVHGFTNVLDLHWRVSNRQSLAGCFAFPDLASRAVAIRALGSHARGLGPLDALLIACVHGPAHHRDEERALLWTYDVHLLAEALEKAQWSALLEYAKTHGIGQLCLASLRESRERFGTGIPADVIGSLCGVRGERSARLLDPKPRDVLWEDLASLGGWRKKLRYVREVTFPSAAYLRQRYGVRSAWMLPAVYLHRGVSGVLRRARAR